MKLAFCLFKYFPFGGLQRDFLRIATALQHRGHAIHVYTIHWEGEVPPGFQLHLIQPTGWQNHARCCSFAQKLKAPLAAEKYDLVIGFNKMPDLDVYYAADVCYQARIKARGGFSTWLPRFRQLLALEKAVFSQESRTDILLISPKEQPIFTHYYHTPASRFHLLPPGISKDRIAPAHASAIRERVRAQYHLTAAHFLLLMVGSGFKTKGVDRSLRALAALPAALRERCQLFILGRDNPAPFLKLSKTLSIKNHIHFLGGRDDVADFLLSADLLLHPSYHENTGTVLLEALVAGLPVLTVDTCGYAHYVQQAEGGSVLTSPFQQEAFNRSLATMLLSPDHATWRQNGLRFAKEADIYSLTDKAAIIIEQLGKKRDALSR